VAALGARLHDLKCKKNRSQSKPQSSTVCLLGMEFNP
jgi:hypothetical protein